MYKCYRKFIKKMENQKIMVIGDMVADVYLEGKISRISREAPVLILEHQAENVVPGGAANAVNNAAALGGQVYAVGVVGSDFAGEQLAATLTRSGVNTSGFITDNSRPTITKTRVMAGGQATVRQQVVRIDREKKEPLSLEVEQHVLNYILDMIGSMHAVVMSDYGSHTVTPTIIKEVIGFCRRKDIPCIVDSRYNVMAYQGINVVKQNESEAAAAMGYETLDHNNLTDAGLAMLEKLNANAVLITRGPDGMALFERSGEISNIPVTNKSEVYDVTGAGDTVVAAMTLAISAGASYLDAARIANYAAGVVVRKPGTSTTTREELYQAIGACDENS